ncbi:MAG: cyclase family protein [Deltaproteobacteria bacterium]|nr:cyclase family protein [Deltaproteobacteria bacterium]
MHLFDLTHRLGPATPVFPGDPPVEVRVLRDLARGDLYALRELTLSNHAGTHVDAPAHVIPGGLTVDRLPLELWIGEAFLVEREDLPSTPLGGVGRLLVAGCAEGLPAGEARRIAEAGVRLLGVDGMSVDPRGSGELPNHRVLLGAGAVLIENLRLEGVPRGWGRLYCLPLAVEGGDGAPARVVWEAEGRGRDA